MDEGPEPQEWVEKAAEEHHHGHEHGASSASREMTVSADHGRGARRHGGDRLPALRPRGQPGDPRPDQGHRPVVLLPGQEHQAADLRGRRQADRGAGAGECRPARPMLVTASLRQFQEERDRYDHEKEDIKKEAEHLEAESRHEFHKHHQFALGIACFQVGIVLASVSILVRLRAIYYLSLLAGSVGLVWVIMGLLAFRDVWSKGDRWVAGDRRPG